MIEVAALTSGRFAPSSRFRVRQHIPELLTHGIRVTEYPPPIDKYYAPGGLLRAHPFLFAPATAGVIGAKLAARLPGLLGSRRADVVWLERELYPGRISLEPLLPRPRLLDVDDAIWLLGDGIRRLARSVDAVIAGNSFLAEWFGRHCKRVSIIPTAVDTERFRPAERADPAAPFVVGWTGSSGNLRYLCDIEAPLSRFLRDHPDARLHVLCDRPPPFRLLDPARVVFTAWSPDNEADVLRQFSAGIMPLADGPWERGKCSFKMLQYMAAGLPVCVSPVGMNAEVLGMAEVGFGVRTEEDWYEALRCLRADRALAGRLGRNGRALAEERFSVRPVAAQLAAALRRLA